MATITVTLSDEQVIAAKDHFGTQDNVEALALFRTWVSNEANGWYAAYLKKDIDLISDALYLSPEQIAAIKIALGL